MVKTHTIESRPIVLGPRVRREIEHRIHELENRFKPSGHDLRELAKLRELLKVTPKERGHE